MASKLELWSFVCACVYIRTCEHAREKSLAHLWHASLNIFDCNHTIWAAIIWASEAALDLNMNFEISILILILPVLQSREPVGSWYIHAGYCQSIPSSRRCNCYSTGLEKFWRGLRSYSELPHCCAKRSINAERFYNCPQRVVRDVMDFSDDAQAHSPTLQQYDNYGNALFLCTLHWIRVCCEIT